MEKAQINNQIISMRKAVKKAKVHVINKLVKEVKQLQKRNGDEAKASKCQRKSERLLFEINLVKKINADAVSKMALSNKDCKNMISDKSVTMENRALARLVSCGPIQRETEQFYSKFPHLVKILPDVLQQWEVKKYSASLGEKGQKAAEIQNIKQKHFKKILSTDPRHCEPVLNENFDSGIKEKEQQKGGKKIIGPDSDKLQHLKKKSQNKAFTGAKTKNLVPLQRTVGGKIHLNRHKSSGVSNSSYCGNKFKYNTKYGHNFGKSPHFERSVMTRRTSKKSIVSQVSNKNLKKQETSHWNAARTNNESKSNRTLQSGFSKPKQKVVQKSITASNEKISCLDQKTPASLHPSWIAKRKMNMEAKNILPFQGKKVKFDE